ncbi:MAG: FAD-dependent oxidoreductase, partial [Anaerolineales bacterium]
GLAVTQQGCSNSRFIKPNRQVLENVDVLVVGGGPAGIGAALGAARKGVKTMIIENHSFFGGVAAWGLGMQINQLRPNGLSRSVVHEQFIQKIQAYGDQAIRFGKHEIWCNVEYMKVAVLDALEETGCRYLLHAKAVDAVVKNNRISGVVIATKQGLKEIRARVVVDCTGDADVAYFAGAETMIDPNDLMPQTLALMLSNLDTEQIPPSEVNKTITNTIHNSRQKYPLNPAGFVEVERLANSSSWWVNHSGTADLGCIDVTDPYEYTRIAAFSNRQAIQMIQSIRESENPGLQQIELVGTGPQVSVRETRRVKGMYVITQEDAMAGQVFDDSIAWRSGYLDLGGQKNRKSGKMMVHDVPFRSIIPEKLDGLLMAGRCISTTHLATAAGKSMGNCMATGHAAGLAAAMCSMKKIVPRDLKVVELQDTLRADDVDLDLKVREQGRM